MKKFSFFLLLVFILTGCETTFKGNIPANYVVGKTKNSIVIGKVKFIDITGEFQEAGTVFEDEATRKFYPFKMGMPESQIPAEKGTVVAEYYFFVELPAGHYKIPEVLAKHSRYQELSAHLLNANLTIKENTVVYVGTIQIQGQGRSLEHIGPITHAEIVDESPQVVRVFRQKYPQFQNVKVYKSIIDRYRWFKGDHIETNFDKDFNH